MDLQDRIDQISLFGVVDGKRPQCSQFFTDLPAFFHFFLYFMDQRPDFFIFPGPDRKRMAFRFTEFPGDFLLHPVGIRPVGQSSFRRLGLLCSPDLLRFSLQ